MQIKCEDGTSLVEILISLSILSLGILGIAKMQCLAIANTSIAFQYSQAASLAQSIAEDIESNPTAAAAGLYQVSPDSDSPTFEKDCYRTICTPSELARWHLATWHSLLSSANVVDVNSPPHMFPVGLGSGKLSIRCDNSCTEGSVRVITIYWDSHHTGASGTGCQQDSRSDLTCFQLALAS